MTWLVDVERIVYEVAIAGMGVAAGWTLRPWWEARARRRGWWRQGKGGGGG